MKRGPIHNAWLRFINLTRSDFDASSRNTFVGSAHFKDDDCQNTVQAIRVIVCARNESTVRRKYNTKLTLRTQQMSIRV